MNNSYTWHVFVSEDKPADGLFSVQFQLPAITITFTAENLLFARRILDFVAETRANPAFRDPHLGNGVFRHMPEKSIDLSASFRDTRIVLLKNGEYDSSYVLRIAPSSSLALIFDISDERLDALLDSLKDIIDDYCDTAKGT